MIYLNQVIYIFIYIQILMINLNQGIYSFISPIPGSYAAFSNRSSARSEAHAQLPADAPRTNGAVATGGHGQLHGGQSFGFSPKMQHVILITLWKMNIDPIDLKA